MSDIIHLLSDAIANQIAAGEVIQRPASVVKELVENAVDAGADHIQVVIKDAGRTLIQIIDNGCGMSETDARMSFERHATSKINTADDLFSLKTMGFRGEALASIASVAQVELRTCKKGEETGTLIQLSASQVEKQETIALTPGSIFSVKNLFFNIPARRKFLKSNETEFKNILTEFERIVLVNPHISFTLIHNDHEVFNLPGTITRQRIVNIFGKNLNQQLLPVHVETSLIRISGFVGTPSSSKKRGALQYFFVNGRYMKHPYFNKAVALAFEPFIAAGESPNYFIFLDVDPATIDVNIHPTKTEIKFENEQGIWQIIMAAVKEAIAKSNTIPSIEFDREGAIDIPVYDKNRTPASAPKISLSQDYNPFKSTSTYQRPQFDWEKLYEKNEDSQDWSLELTQEDDIPEKENKSQENTIAQLFEDEFNHFQYKGKYLITPLKSGLVLIHQRRAHVRILFDEYMNRMKEQKGITQGMLFPEVISFTPKEATILPYLLEELAYIGFDLGNLGNNSYSINGIPAGLEKINPIETLQTMVDKVMETGCEIKEEVCEALALALAKQAAIPFGKTLSDEESNNLIATLFASSSPNYTPDGKVIISTLSDEELEKRFK